jgi:hypothetical protein
MPALFPVLRRLLSASIATAVPAALILSTAASSVAAPSIPGVAPGCSWQAQTLPLPAGWQSGVPNRGDGDSTYAGYGLDATQTSRPLLWRAGSVQVISSPGGASAQARDVNRSGVVVANATDANGVGHPYLWKNGSITELASPPGTSASVNSINDAGMVVGSATIDGGTHVIVWTVRAPTTYTDLGTGGNVNAYPTDVSNRGLIVGRNASAGFGQDSHAIGGTTDPRLPVQPLPGLDPTYNSRALASEGTYIVGVGRLPDSSNGASGGPLYADLATSTSPKALIGQGTPQGVNTRGLIAGSGPGGGYIAATVWTSTQRWVMPNPLGGTASSSATDVMDNGTVIGDATAPGQVAPLTWTCQ